MILYMVRQEFRHLPSIELISGQIEFWAMIGRAALDNPDLPIDFVRDLLIARSEGKTLLTSFVPEGKRD
jgi:hypothetical protein